MWRPTLLSIRLSPCRRLHVCRYFSITPNPSPPSVCRPPWILLPRTSADENNELVQLHSIRDKTSRSVFLPLGLRYTSCLGSSSFHLVLLDRYYTPVLLNLATGRTYQLPSIDDLHHQLPGVVQGPSDVDIHIDPLSAQTSEVEVFDGNVDGRKLQKVVGLNSVFYETEVACEGPTVTDKGLYFGKTVVAFEKEASSMGSSSSYIAIGIYGKKRQLAIARMGDKRWTTMITKEMLFDDVIYHKGWFYGVCGRGSVEAIDPAAMNKGHTQVLVAPEMRQEPGKRYLVESCDDLFFINRLIGRIPIQTENGGNGYRTTGFEVFKLDLSGPRWIKTGNLGNRSFFIGANHSVSLSADDLPELKGNSIYFLDDYWEHNLWFSTLCVEDFGVFDIVNSRIQPLSSFDQLLSIPAPVWIIPTADDFNNAKLPATQEELKDIQGDQDSYRAPWLMFPRTKQDETNGTCRLYSIQDKEEFSVHFPVGLRWSCCLGSSSGWLVTVDSKLVPYLTNPLTGSQVPLPPINNLPGMESARKMKLYMNRDRNCIYSDAGLYFGKAVLSWNPTSTSNSNPILPAKRDYVVVAIQGHERQLVCAREGDWSWSLLKVEHSGFQDVIHYDGVFYAVTGGRGIVEAFDLNGQVPDVIEELLGPKTEECPQKRYLVNSSGNLLMVSRFIVKTDSIQKPDDYIYQLESRSDYIYECTDRNVEYKTIGFKVYKLSPKERMWHELKTLGDRSLILGSNHSLSVSVTDFPELRSNRIYFTDDHYKQSSYVDSGVFCLGDGIIESLTPFGSHLSLPSPIFIFPTRYQ